uniref:Uncharacterized protein n=1 Tax=viral metagenome TaxID=1070528 RepID=A0A6C0L0Q3_9ZZZZ|tara:strand:+ start:6972 stop:7880 length:909 start_codon:yes stop_codon:yes gene_type:complete
MTAIVSATDFTPANDMMYTKVKINSVGGKSIGIINSNTKRSLMVSTPIMLNWGVNVFDNQNGTKAYSLSLQFPREEFSTDSTNELLNMLKDMESKILDDAVENSKDWFGKSQSREVVEAFWNPILKYPKNQETQEPDTTRAPTLKVKLPMWDGVYKFELFDMSNNLLIPNDEGRSPDMVIQKASNIACVIQCGGIWMANGNFGVSWKLFQAKYKENIQLEVGKGVCHVPLSEEDSSKMAVSGSSEDETTNIAGNTTMVESDDEGEPETEVVAEQSVQIEEQEPVPVEQKPKKKRVVKKKSTE